MIPLPFFANRFIQIRVLHGPLDPSIGEFCLSHLIIKTPEQGRIYSLNEGKHVRLPEGVKAYIPSLPEDDAATGRPYTCRYISSLVSNFHRNLLKGGIFICPPTGAAPKGKQRLVYECNPIAMVAEQAGGRATDGHSGRLNRLPRANPAPQRRRGCLPPPRGPAPGCPPGPGRRAGAG
ncbi:MAG: hypothetical protein ABR558_01940 [Thioalkalivibrio sp.]